MLAVSGSQVDSLPHQIKAVYEHVLQMPRPRFMIADDAGAGGYIDVCRIQDGEGQPQTAIAVFRGTSGTLLERLHPLDLDTEPSIPVVVAGREDDLHDARCLSRSRVGASPGG
jgi:hypothetical protein